MKKSMILGMMMMVLASCGGSDDGGTNDPSSTSGNNNIVEGADLSTADLKDIGRVLGVKGTKGYIYSTTIIAAENGAMASGMIAYISSKGHGIVIALSDVGNTAMHSTAVNYCTNYAVPRPVDYGTSVSGWKMPSTGTYNLMFSEKGCKNYSNLREMRGPNSGNCGGTVMKSSKYWTTTHNSVNYFCKDMSNGNEVAAKASELHYVRPYYSF